MGAQLRSQKKEITPEEDQKEAIKMFKSILELPGEKEKES